MKYPSIDEQSFLQNVQFIFHKDIKPMLQRWTLLKSQKKIGTQIIKIVLITLVLQILYQQCLF